MLSILIVSAFEIKEKGTAILHFYFGGAFFKGNEREMIALSGQLDKQERTMPKVDYVKVAKSPQFKKLMQDRKRFILPLTIFFFVFYFMLPILTSYTTFLNTPVFGDISWVWIFAFSQFVMTWVLCTIYVKKASSFDEQADQIIADQIEKGGKAS